MARPGKIARVESLAAIFNEARSVVLNDFTGLNVEKISKLRRLCRENGVEYVVVKNTLARRSLKGTPAEDLETHFEGPTALAIGRETENVSAKVLAEFAKEHEAPKFKAGIVDGKVIDATEVLALSRLSSREELLSQALAGIMSPGNGLVSVLQGTLRNLLYAFNAIIDKKQTEGGDIPQESK
ncbi:MAG: 50S ribosomal protein L10 [Candidatus Krumholzibacteriia bacterium]